MSMILGLTTVSDSTIDRLLDTPVLIWRVVLRDERDIAARMASPQPRTSLLARLFGKKRRETVSQPVPELTFADGERNDADLDKAWHGIHFLLTGSDWDGDPPLNFLVVGGAKVGNVDVGYGPARAFRSAEVATINSALTAVDTNDMRKRYAPEAMMEADIYPTIWNHDPAKDDALAYLLEYFAVLREFIGAAARKGLGVVITMT